MSFFIGLISIIICFIVFYKFKKYSKKVFGIALILGTFSIILFTPFQMGFSIGFIKIQVISFLFLAAFIFINRTRIIDLMQNSSNKTQEEIELESKSKQDRFKRDFENLSDIEINNRLKYNLTHEARKALTEIGAERENKKFNSKEIN